MDLYLLWHTQFAHRHSSFFSNWFMNVNVSISFEITCSDAQTSKAKENLIILSFERGYWLESFLSSSFFDNKMSQYCLFQIHYFHFMEHFWSYTLKLWIWLPVKNQLKWCLHTLETKDLSNLTNCCFSTKTGKHVKIWIFHFTGSIIII